MWVQNSSVLFHLQCSTIFDNTVFICTTLCQIYKCHVLANGFIYQFPPIINLTFCVINCKVLTFFNHTNHVAFNFKVTSSVPLFMKWILSSFPKCICFAFWNKYIFSHPGEDLFDVYRTSASTDEINKLKHHFSAGMYNTHSNIWRWTLGKLTCTCICMHWHLFIFKFAHVATNSTNSDFYFYNWLDLPTSQTIGPILLIIFQGQAVGWKRILRIL
jgi:hypothetical protein